MNSLEHEMPMLPEMPRFDDGTVNIQELIRIMAESIVNEIMDAQAEDACADGNQRNGYRARELTTSGGKITLRIPKLRRGIYFPEDLLIRYSRVDRAVIASISEMVTNGVSTRKVERVAKSLGIDRMSRSQVSRICESLDGIVDDLQTRSLSDVTFPYVWLDATYIKCRDEIAKISARSAELLEDAEADALAYLGFPYVHHKRLRTNNVQERCNREPKRRSRVVQVFPSRKSLVRMLGAVFSEMDEDWSSRRWFSKCSMALLEAPQGPKALMPSYDGTAEEHARRIIDFVVADNPIGRKVA